MAAEPALQIPENVDELIQLMVKVILHKGMKIEKGKDKTIKMRWEEGEEGEIKQQIKITHIAQDESNALRNEIAKNKILSAQLEICKSVLHAALPLIKFLADEDEKQFFINFQNLLVRFKKSRPAEDEAELEQKSQDDYFLNPSRDKMNTIWNDILDNEESMLGEQLLNGKIEALGERLKKIPKRALRVVAILIVLVVCYTVPLSLAVSLMTGLSVGVLSVLAILLYTFAISDGCRVDQERERQNCEVKIDKYAAAKKELTDIVPKIQGYFNLFPSKNRGNSGDAQKVNGYETKDVLGDNVEATYYDSSTLAAY